MQSRDVVLVGGCSLIVGAVAFVAVFGYLAANFDYPRVLDGAAADVLPRLRAGGARMRAVWGIYSLLPLLLTVGSVGVFFALPSRPGLAALGTVFATVGSLAMCLGLMRWPSVHWALAEAYESGGSEARHSIAAVFSGLNLYLGNYVGEFLGEVHSPAGCLHTPRLSQADQTPSQMSSRSTLCGNWVEKVNRSRLYWSSPIHEYASTNCGLRQSCPRPVADPGAGHRSRGSDPQE